MREVRFAVKGVSGQVVAEWGIFAWRLFAAALGRRIRRFGRFATEVGVFLWREGKNFVDATRRREAIAHLKGRGLVAWSVTGDLADCFRRGVSRIPRLLVRLRDDPAAVAPDIIGLTAGFFLGSGGFDADGGIPDADLLLGIGHHRSVLTHSIIAGSVAEASILSTVVLTRILHDRLPEDHDPFWDAMKPIGERFALALSRGTSAGIALHLGSDATIDGMTTFKDLPVHVGVDGHRAFLGLNALAEALGTASMKVPVKDK
jgi:hypothetical protein